MDRNCDKCIHHTSGMCDSWDCKMQTVDDLKKEVREKTIEEFAEALNKRCDAVIKDKWNDGTSPVSWSHAYADFKDDIDEIAEELKKNLNETQAEVKGE